MTEQPPTSAFRAPDGSTRVHVPDPSWLRYYGYLADMYWAIDEMRRLKTEWYAEREKWLPSAMRRSPNGTEEDVRRGWSKTPLANDLAGLEQWAHRQVLAYGLAAERELDRLTGKEEAGGYHLSIHGSTSSDHRPDPRR